MKFLIAASLVLSCSLCLADRGNYVDDAKSLNASEAAKIVAESEGQNLWLWQLESIDKAVAQELGKHVGFELHLAKVASIDKDVAEGLAKFTGNSLNLNGLTSIDKDIAKELAKFKGQSLLLDKVKSIDKDIAEELAKFEGKGLDLDGVDKIDKETARELAKFKGDLSVGIGTFPATEVLHELIKFKGRLNLSSYPVILNKKEMAQEIGKFECSDLTIPGLVSLDKDCALGLVKFASEEGPKSRRRMNLNGLEKADEEVVEILKSNWKISAPCLKESN